MRTPSFAAALALSLTAAAAGAQQPTTPSTPSSPTAPQTTPAPTQPDSGTMRDSAMGRLPRPGMMQDSMARRGGMRDSMAMRGGARGGDLVAEVDSVNAAAKAGLTSLPVSAATALIESIETKLRGSGRPPLVAIAGDLGALRRELGMPTVNGARVGTILRRVGPRVTAVAAAQHGPVSASLRELGRELTGAGRQLSAARAAAPAGH